MTVNGLLRNDSMIENFNGEKMDYLDVATHGGNETSFLVENGSTIPKIIPLALTSAIFLSAPPKSNTSSSYNSTNTKDEFQLYVIGIYGFFAVVFGFGIIMILIKKLHKACCTSSKSDGQEYESVPYREDLSPEENLAFDHQINVSFLDVNRRGPESENDNYSEISFGEREPPIDKPPAYEDPPSYSITQ